MALAAPVADLFLSSTIAGSLIKGQQEAGHQKRAAASAEQAAEETAAAGQRAVKKANAKTPDLANILFGNKQGVSDTNLTGAAGAPVGASAVGTNTLLGQ